MIDEFGLGGLTANQRADLLEIINERTREGGKSVIVTSVCPMDVWASCIGDVSFSDSILDRLIHRAWRLNLEGPSMRSRRVRSTGRSLWEEAEALRRKACRHLSNLEFDRQ